MGRSKQKVKVHLNSQEINILPMSEIIVILRAADDLIAVGGRTLLAKILKGSREKKVLELKLDQNPSYGYFNKFKIEEIVAKIDWMIRHNYLEIEYSGRLPMIIFTEKGWEIESEQYADELLTEWDNWIENKITPVNMEYLKDRNRGMILLYLEKINKTRDPKYVPFLKQWKEIEYKKVKKVINQVIHYLEESQ
jgi:hypothetical protein